MASASAAAAAISDDADAYDRNEPVLFLDDASGDAAGDGRDDETCRLFLDCENGDATGEDREDELGVDINDGDGESGDPVGARKHCSTRWR